MYESTNTNTNLFCDHQDALERVVQFFETLTVQSAQTELPQIYAEDASFKDPFNEVRGLSAITPLFTHMFVQVENPRFVITTRVLQGNQAFITWDFLFHMKRYARDEQCIRGATQLRFNDAGLVEMHRDFWDAAEQLYEKLPVVGSLMRLLKKIARK
jgi:steroid delta-isomerase